MLKSFGFIFSAALVLSGCSYAVPSNGNDTSFERVGTQNCPTAESVDQTRLVGTARDPLRCGPQTQAIPR